MSPENLSIDSKNQALKNIIDIYGVSCGAEILELFLHSRLALILGEPNSGKSTLAGELCDEAKRRDINTIVKKYDHMLLAFTAISGSAKEGPEFNTYIVSEMENALSQSTESDIVVMDTVGVDNADRKDRSVTAVNKTAQLTDNTSALGILTTSSNQFRRALVRNDILISQPEDVLEIMERNHNIVVYGIPLGITNTDMGRLIQQAVLRMAQQVHVAQILHEVISQGLAVVRSRGSQILPDVAGLNGTPYHGILSLQLKFVAMQERMKEIPVPQDAKKIVLNLDRGRRMAWYADDVLRGRRNIY